MTMIRKYYLDKALDAVWGVTLVVGCACVSVAMLVLTANLAWWVFTK